MRGYVPFSLLLFLSSCVFYGDGANNEPYGTISSFDDSSNNLGLTSQQVATDPYTYQGLFYDQTGDAVYSPFMHNSDAMFGGGYEETAAQYAM